MIQWFAPSPRPLWRQPAALIALTWLVLVGLGASLAPILAPAGPMAADTTQTLLPPGTDRLLGTDLLGRDVMTRLLWGGRWTLEMGLTALTMAVGLGLPTGLIAGFFGGRIEAVLMRLVDALLAFPGLLLAMAIVALLGPGVNSVALAVGIAAAPAYARIARSATLEVRTRPYIEAAQSVGCSEWRIMARHILPNAAATLTAFAATQLGWVLLNGAALNFLGLGAPPGTPEWGAMLAEGRGYLRDAPWVSTFPGLALTLTVLAANLVGDGLQEALRPR
ncbi:MAG: ABC transporter permease [Chloroflexi bacterium]|nr:MAG: ABC transporter permease [Chloroflexota bacterium]